MLSEIQSDSPRTVRYDWLAQVAATAQRSKTLHLGLALAWLAAKRGVPGVALTRRTLAKWSLSRDAAYDGIKVLQAAGLVIVWSLPGRAHHVVLVEPGTDTPLRLDSMAGTGFTVPVAARSEPPCPWRHAIPGRSTGCRPGA